MKLKDKKIVIYTYVGGNTNYRLNAEGPFWAYFRQMSTQEIYEARAMTQKEEAIFTINHHESVKVYDLVLFRGTYYKVNRIDEYEGNRDDMKLYAATYNSKPVIVP